MTGVAGHRGYLQHTILTAIVDITDKYVDILHNIGIKDKNDEDVTRRQNFKKIKHYV